MRPSAAAGDFAALGRPCFGQDAGEAAPSWVDRPMRWAQLTLVENDPGSFSVPFWLDYFRRTRSDAANPG